MNKALRLVRALARAPSRFSTWLHEFIEEMVEDLPDTLDAFATGWSPNRIETPDQKLERIIRTSLRRDRLMFGRKDYLLSYNMISMAEFYQSRKRHADAHSWYCKAIAILELHFKLGEPRLTDAYKKTADFLMTYLQHAEAARLYKLVLDATAMSVPADSPALLEPLSNLAKARLAAGDIKGGIEALESRFAITVLDKGPGSMELISILEALASSYKDCSDLKSYARVKRKLDLLYSLSIWEEALDADNPALIKDVRLLAVCYEVDGDLRSRDILLHRVRFLELIGKTSGGNYPRLPADLEELAEMYEKRALYADKTVGFRLRKRAEHIRKDRLEGRNRYGLSIFH